MFHLDYRAFIPLIFWMHTNLFNFEVNATLSYVFYEDKVPWNDAKITCESIGGRLANLIDEDDQRIQDQLPDKYQQNKEAWIAGFTEALPCSGTDVNVRYSDCSSVLSSSLNIKAKCPASSQCMSVHLKHHMHWETCSKEISFICETEDISHTISTYSTTTITPAPPDMVVELDGSIPSCQDACTSININGSTCQYYTNGRSVSFLTQSVCRLYLYESSTVTYSSGVTGSYTYNVRTVYPTGYVNTTTITATHGQTDTPLMTCPQDAVTITPKASSNTGAVTGSSITSVIPSSIQGCTFESLSIFDIDAVEDITATIDYKVETFDDCLVLCNENSLQIVNTEAPCWVAHMFSPIAKGCRLIYRYENLTSTYFDTHTTGASQWDSLFVKKCPFYDATTVEKTTTTTSTAPTTSTGPTTTTEPSTTAPPTVINLNELKVDIKSTGNWQRKFISIYESRPSAVGVGLLGGIFVGTLLIAIIIGDLPVLARHIKLKGMYNIKNRNLCSKRELKIEYVEQSKNRVRVHHQNVGTVQKMNFIEQNKRNLTKITVRASAKSSLDT